MGPSCCVGRGVLGEVGRRCDGMIICGRSSGKVDERIDQETVASMWKAGAMEYTAIMLFDPAG